MNFGMIEYIQTPRGRLYERIRVGKERNPYYNFKPGEKCGDCGAKFGEYHRDNCDIELCPVCGDQLISCDHIAYYVSKDITPADALWSFAKKGLRFWGIKIINKKIKKFKED